MEGKGRISVTRNSNRTESMRDLMLGRKVVKKLPDNFFEKVLDLELKLKRSFNLNHLQQLVSYYSTAIEYYESQEDPRFREYQNNLNLLLSQPEVLKKIGRNSPFSSNTAESDPQRVIKQSKIIHKQNLMKSSVKNSENVKHIMKEMKEKENDKSAQIEEVINGDMNKQETDFKKKLEEKRRKSQLSTSDVMDHKNKNYIKESANRSLILDSKLDWGDVNTSTITDNILDPSEFLIDNLDNTFDNLNLRDEFDDIKSKNSDILGLNRTQFRPVNQKQKMLVGDIKQSVDVFIKDYNNYFFDNFFTKIFENLKTVIDEKNEKREESIKNYNTQIKEMEGLLNEESEENYKESITDIIKSLNEEMKNEVEKIEGEYKTKTDELKIEFSKSNIREESEVQLMEERFKLDVYNSVGNMINLK